MRPRVVVYVTAEELAEMRRAAARRRVSLSRYAKERLAPQVHDEDGNDLTAERLGVRKMLAERTEGLAENLRTVIVMLDQLVRSTLTHLPEIPEAHKERMLAAGDRRHRNWQQEVEALLRRMRAEPHAERQGANGNGAHA